MAKLPARVTGSHIVAALRSVGCDMSYETSPHRIAGEHAQHFRKRARVNVPSVSAKLEGEPARAKLVGRVLEQSVRLRRKQDGIEVRGVHANLQFACPP